MKAAFWFVAACIFVVLVAMFLAEFVNYVGLWLSMGERD